MRNVKLTNEQHACRWPRKVKVGMVTVTVYRRKTKSGNWTYLVTDYTDGKRRFDSYTDLQDALRAASGLARSLSERDVISATMTREQAIDYASAAQILKPFNLLLAPAASALAQVLKVVGDISHLTQAVKCYANRHKIVTSKRIAEVVAEFLSSKQQSGLSARYLQDLRARLNRFADTFRVDADAVTTAEVQGWFDKMRFAPQNYANFRTVLHTFFEFAVTRGYAHDNPVANVEKRKIKSTDTEIFTPEEIGRLLNAASDDFRPCIALGAFAGLRSAEIERLEWTDIDLVGKTITVGAQKAKTASRRIIPLPGNLIAWLAPHAHQTGLVWKGSHDEFYEAQQATAKATAITGDVAQNIAAKPAVVWKANALRHSYASYRFAQCGDAGRVAGEIGNSAPVVHKHYRELVKPVDAQRWFAIQPDSCDNVIAFKVGAN